MRSKCWGGVFDEPTKPIEPPIEKPEPPVENPETPTTPPSTKNLQTIKIEDNIMAVVGTNAWNDIAYGNGKFVAVGDNGYITTSTNGTSWTTPKQITTTSNLYNIAFGNGVFVTVCYDYVAWSPDGNNWTMIPFNSYSFAKVIYANNRFIASAGKYCFTSIDGKTWSTKADTGVNKVVYLLYADNRFMVIGLDRTISVSSDGTTWSLLPNSEAKASSLAAYGNGMLVMINGRQVWRSTDMQNWSVYEIPYVGNRMFQSTCITFHNNMFILIGILGRGTTNAEYCAITTADGETFSDYIRLNFENGDPTYDYINGMVVIP